MTSPAFRRNQIGWKSMAQGLAALLLLAVSACAPHSELKSPCHVAAVSVNPDCGFTPINSGTS